MRILITLLLGTVLACAILGVAIVLLFKRGGWELEQRDRERGL